MEAITAQRRLVKSPPELWSQLSDAQELARHLGEFGEIRITRLEAERTVAWEGDRARGTVELEPSGWGTKVTLTAESVGSKVAEAEEPPEPGGRDHDDDDDVRDDEDRADDGRGLLPPALELTVESPALKVPVLDPAPDPDPEPPPDPAPIPGPNPALAPPRKPRFFARLFGRRRPPKLSSAATNDGSSADRSSPLDAALGPAATVAGRQTFVQDLGVDGEVAPEQGGGEAEAREGDADAVEGQAEPVDDDAERREGDPEQAGVPAASLVDAVRPESHAESEKTAAILETVLDDLGAAHHRPFSRG